MSAAARRWPRRRVLVLLTAALTVVAAALVVWSIRMSTRVERASTTWDTGMASARVIEFTDLRVPGSAVDIRSGYLNGLQDDSAVVSFRLPTDQVDGFTAGLGIGRWEEVRRVTDTALDGFRHVGAPDPTGAFPLRRGVFQSQPPVHEAVTTTVWLGSPAEGSTQVWVYTVNTP